jgi:hypothetical protein
MNTVKSLKRRIPATSKETTENKVGELLKTNDLVLTALMEQLDQANAVCFVGFGVPSPARIFKGVTVAPAQVKAPLPP